METLICEEAIIEVTSEPDVVPVRVGDNHSTRRMGTHSDEPPASPSKSDATTIDGMQMGTPVRTSEVGEARSEADDSQTTESESEDEERDELPVSFTPIRDRAATPYPQQGTHTAPADLPYGYGFVPLRASRPWNGTAVAPMPRQESGNSAPATGDQAITTHVPATEPHRFRQLNLLADQDLPHIGQYPENVNLAAHDIRNHDQAYPYARRYSRPAAMQETKAIFECLGLGPRGYLRYDPDGSEEFAFHPTVLSALINADWRLESQMSHSPITPTYPTVVPGLDINTSLHNYTDSRFSVAPFFMPVSPAAAFASRQKWLPVQRGVLLTMEELNRAAIHNQSGILHAVEEVQSRLNLPAIAPDLMYALETMLVPADGDAGGARQILCTRSRRCWSSRRRRWWSSSTT